MPGDHYYDRDQRDQSPSSVAADMLKKARAAAEEARTRLRDVQITTGAGGAHAPQAIELLTAALAEIDAALATCSSRP